MKISAIWTDKKYGRLYVIETEREYVELRVTPSGLLRIGDVGRGEHPNLRAVREHERRGEASDAE